MSSWCQASNKLVITSLEFPYYGATADRTCVPSQQAIYPDRRCLVLHSSSEPNPPISYSVRKGFGNTQREMGLLSFLMKAVLALLGGGWLVAILH